MSTVNSSTTATSSTQNVASSLTQSLDPTAFLKLFTTELSNQDPTKPMDDSTFLNQIAEISQVQTMGELQQSLGGLTTSLSSLVNSSQINDGTGMLGKTVQYTDATGASQQGVVNSMAINSDGSINLSIGGSTVPMTSVQQVFPTP